MSSYALRIIVSIPEVAYENLTALLSRNSLLRMDDLLDLVLPATATQVTLPVLGMLFRYICVSSGIWMPRLGSLMSRGTFFMSIIKDQ